MNFFGAGDGGEGWEGRFKTVETNTVCKQHFEATININQQYDLFKLFSRGNNTNSNTDSKYFREYLAKFMHVWQKQLLLSKTTVE